MARIMIWTRCKFRHPLTSLSSIISGFSHLISTVTVRFDYPAGMTINPQAVATYTKELILSVTDRFNL